MTLKSIQQSLFENRRFQEIVRDVCKYSVTSQFKAALSNQPQIQWDKNYLITAASLFASSSKGEHQDFALRVAHLILTHEETTEEQKTAATIILDDMANAPAIKLALQRRLISNDFKETVPFVIKARLTNNRLSSTINLQSQGDLRLTRFQYKFWESLDNASWVSVSAPTSAGKSFVITRWLLEHLPLPGEATVYLVPTRALISQVERDLKFLCKGRQDISIATLPTPDSVHPNKRNLLILTQERLHLLWTRIQIKIDHLVVDEAHKIGDNHRGVLLQHVIESIVDRFPNIGVTYISPMSENPEALLRDAPSETTTTHILAEDVTVNQNLIWVTQKRGKPKDWEMQLCHHGETIPIGDFKLPFEPDPPSKRLPFVAYALRTSEGGNIIYANGAAESEKLSLQLYSLAGESTSETTKTELKNLSDLISEVVHEDYLLREVVKRGIAFHYGNMPLTIRSEIERLFSTGHINFLICTSTLIEGVNTACKTITVRGPRRGKNKKMTPEDFWNLAGRAGRLGREFQGNIICVDSNKPDLWEGGSPPRKRSHFKIKRTTDEVMNNVGELITYIKSNAPRSDASKRQDLEFTSTYFMICYKRFGSLSNIAWAKHIDATAREYLEKTLAETWTKLAIPLEITERNPGINPIALQNLLDYFKTRTVVDGKPIEELLPPRASSDDAVDLFTSVITRCANHLNAALGPPGKRCYIIALLVTRWMRGYSLSRLITDRLQYLSRRKEEVDTNRVIREVLQDVEQIARFEAPRTISAYIDVLNYYLITTGHFHLASELEDIALFMEVGTSIRTQLSLMNLGLSRATAIRLSEIIADDKLDTDDARKWLETSIWKSANLPVLMQQEVLSALG